VLPAERIDEGRERIHTGGQDAELGAHQNDPSLLHDGREEGDQMREFDTLEEVLRESEKDTQREIENKQHTYTD
jgi:hypothetical protein